MGPYDIETSQDGRPQRAVATLSEACSKDCGPTLVLHTPANSSTERAQALTGSLDEGELNRCRWCPALCEGFYNTMRAVDEFLSFIGAVGI